MDHNQEYLAENISYQANSVAIELIDDPAEPRRATLPAPGAPPGERRVRTDLTEATVLLHAAVTSWMS